MMSVIKFLGTPQAFTRDIFILCNNYNESMPVQVVESTASKEEKKQAGTAAAALSIFAAAYLCPSRTT
jgi:hypothetical protein